MSPAQFPARSADGTFCVVIGVEMSGSVQGDLVPRIRAWISDAWMPGNATWAREWRTGSDLATSRVEELHFNDEFTGPPEVSAGSTSELQLRLRGKKTSKFWKDWLVLRLVPELKVAFPGVGELLYIRDCTE
jgi:hypothetical protein